MTLLFDPRVSVRPRRTSLTWDFFTKLPTPVGETGGGMANALLGSAQVAAAGQLHRHTDRISGRRLSGRIRRVVVLFYRPVHHRPLNGVPSIVIGIFAYTLIVLPQGHFSTFAGGIALGVMMIPIAIRSSEDFLRAVPVSLREGAMALGASKAKTIFTW